MKSLGARLIFAAIGAAALSTPSFSQSPYVDSGSGYDRYLHDSGAYGVAPVGRPLYDVAPGYSGPYASGTVGAYGGALYDQATTSYPVSGYPNPVSHSGSASSLNSGAAFNLNYGYPAIYEYTDE